MAYADIESALDATESGDVDTDSTGDSSTADIETNPRMKLSPIAAVTGEIVDVGFTGDVFDEQNIRGEGFGGDFVFTLKNPSIERGALFEAHGRRDAEDGLAKNLTDSDIDIDGRTPTRDFRLVDEAVDGESYIDEVVKEVDGEYTDVGISIFGSDFIGGECDDLTAALDATGHDKIDVFVGGQAGRMMMSSIDATLNASAYFRDDGSMQAGMVEYPRDYGTNDWNPDAGSNYPRAARRPVLHPEVEGNEVTLFYHFGDLQGAVEGDDGDANNSTTYRKHYGDLLMENDDGVVVLTQMDDVLEPDFELVDEATTWIEFEDPPSGDERTDSGGAASNGSSDGDVSFSALESADETTQISDLDPQAQEFAEQAAGIAADTDGGVDGAFGSFEDTVAEAQDQGELPGEHSPAAIRAAVENSIDS